MDQNIAATISLVTFLVISFGTIAYITKCDRDVSIEKLKFMSNMCEKAGIKITQSDDKNVTITLNDENE